MISPLTAAQMKQMLQGVVLHGTGRKAILEGYSSAGKTGTAQKVDPATGAYSKTKYVASFAGFAPINDPKISVAVILGPPIFAAAASDVNGRGKTSGLVAMRRKPRRTTQGNPSGSSWASRLCLALLVQCWRSFWNTC